MSIVFNYNYDINIYHEYMLNAIKDELDSDISQQIQIYNTIIYKSNNSNDIRYARKRLKELKSRSISRKEQYINDIEPILYEYNNITRKSKLFGVDLCDNIYKRIYIIKKYFNVCKQYIKLSYLCTYNTVNICIKCFIPMKRYNNIYECTCGYISNIDKCNFGINIRDGKVMRESTYKSDKNFKKEVISICGLSSKVTPKERYDIDVYLYHNNIYFPTRNDIRNAISACGYKNYNDVNDLYYILCKEPLPNITEYIETICNRFKKYSDVFHKISHVGINITNLHFLMKLFLWQEKVTYNKEWVKSLTSITIDKHSKNAHIICKKLQLEYPNEFWGTPLNWYDI